MSVSENTHQYDFIVIGGGSGGVAAARRAASYGARVALIENQRLGGTCVNVGCVPKKVMWHASALASGFADAVGYGFAVPAIAHDWAKLVTGRDAYVQRLNGIYADMLAKAKVTVIEGTGALIDTGNKDDQGHKVLAVKVGDLQLSAPHILIATGGHPHRPGIPGHELGIDSDGFFDLKARPEKVAVLGGGYIAVELAGVLHGLGSEVTVIARSTLVREFDALLGDKLTENMRRDGIDVLLHTDIKAVHGHDGHYTVSDGKGNTLGPYQQVLWATGRAPALHSLGLSELKLGIELPHGKGIAVDADMATRHPGLYAVGDITGSHMLTPVAIACGRALADRLFNGKTRQVDLSLIPTVVFTHPPIATCGISEAEARKQHGDEVRVYNSQFNPLFYGILEHKVPAHVKLVCAGANERVVGCHVIGEGADEMMQGFAVAMSMGATKQDFDNTIAIHPTSAEELVTLR